MIHKNKPQTRIVKFHKQKSYIKPGVKALSLIKVGGVIAIIIAIAIVGILILKK